MPINGVFDTRRNEIVGQFDPTWWYQAKPDT